MNNWFRALAHKTAILAAVTASVLPVAAQDPTPTQQPTPAPQTAPVTSPQTPPLSRPIPNRLSGLEPGKEVRWALKDAILAALEKNVDIDIERENVRLAQFDLFATRGVYDPLTTSTVLYNSAKNPNAFRFSGSTENFTKVDSLTYNFAIKKNLERYGASYEVDFNNRRSTSNTSNLATQYSPAVTVLFTQPLMKNFRIDLNRRQLKIAKKKLDLSDAVFRQRAIEIISRVQQAYWDLALAIRDEQIQRDSVKLAETQLNNNQRQVEVGTLAPIDVISAATTLESRRQQVFQAMNAVGVAENNLKALTVESPTSDLWTTQIIPVEPFEIKPITIPLNDALKLAMENRPEVKQFVLQKESNQIDVDYYRNQTKPQVDLVGSYSTAGLGGTPSVTTGLAPNCSAPVQKFMNDSNSRFCVFPVVVADAAGNFIVQPSVPVPFNPAVPFTTTASVANQFIGSYGTSLTNLFRNEFRTWSVGIQFSFPLRNRTAQANLGRALESGRQLDLQTRRQMQTIEVEVRNAIQSVETAKLRIEASRAAREYAQQQLEGEGKKFAAGLSTTFFVLQRQTDLSIAQGTELRALADYNKSVAELQRAISTTLSSNNIEVKSDVPTSDSTGSNKK